MSRRRPRVEPDDRLAQLRDQLEQAEERVLYWCSVECRHRVLSEAPPGCGHPDEVLCGMARRRVESLRRMVAEGEARLGA